MTVKGLEMRWHKDVTSRDLARDNSTGVERKDANAAERWVGGSRSEDTRRTQRVLAESFDTAACLEIFKIKKKKIKEKKGKCRQRITRFSRSPPCFPPQTLEAVIAGLLPFSYWRRILLPLFYLCLERPYKATLCAEENWDLSFLVFVFVNLLSGAAITINRFRNIFLSPVRSLKPTVNPSSKPPASGNC